MAFSHASDGIGLLVDPCERHYGYDSPDSEEHLERDAQNVPRPIKIPRKTMLGIMLTELGLPEAMYNFEAYEDGSVCVTVEIDDSASQPGESEMFISVQGSDVRTFLYQRTLQP